MRTIEKSFTRYAAVLSCVVVLSLPSGWSLQAQERVFVETHEIELPPLFLEGEGDHRRAVKLPRPVPLGGVEAVILDGLQNTLSTLGGTNCVSMTARFALLSGDEEVLEGFIGSWNWCGGQRTFLFRNERTFFPRTDVVDGVLLKVHLEGDAGVTIAPLFDVGALRLHFERGYVRTDGVPEGRNELRRIESAQPITVNGPGSSPWERHIFDEPVDATQLKLIFGPEFNSSSQGSSGSASEVSLILDGEDEAEEILLDDANVPGSGQAVQGLSVSSHMKLLDRRTRMDLRGRSIVGVKWLLHNLGNGTSTRTPFQGGTFLAFLYDDSDCDGDGESDLEEFIAGTHEDQDEDDAPDGCVTDCNGNGEPDVEEIAGGATPDCNANNVPDSCEVSSGAVADRNENEIPDSCEWEFEVSPETLDFGVVPLASSRTLELTVTNTGPIDLPIEGARVLEAEPADYSVASGGEPILLPPGETHTVEIAFEPGSVETHGGDLLIYFEGRVFPEIVVSVSGEGVDPLTFRRGDVDANGELEITDAINTLAYQFLGNFAPPCLDAVDFDDNSEIEVTDAINSLSHQFLGLAPPSAPGKETCGVDPTADELGCEAYDACP